ncbi:MAG TPA: hypothetical protein PKE45_06370 [Caldilineaceae bacterium]|nr:hypothetical protein [Caldilineaceae bacterium]
MSETPTPAPTLRDAETLRLMGQYDRALKSFDEIIKTLKEKNKVNVGAQQYERYKQALESLNPKDSWNQEYRATISANGVAPDGVYKAFWIPEKGLKAEDVLDIDQPGVWVLTNDSEKAAYCLEVSGTGSSIYTPSDSLEWAVAHCGGTHLGSAVQKIVQNNAPDEELEKARKDLQLAVTLNPKHCWPLVKLAEVWRIKGNEPGSRERRMENYRKALSYFDRAIECDSGDIQARAHRAATYVNARFFGETTSEEVDKVQKDFDYVNQVTGGGYAWANAYQAAFDFLMASTERQEKLPQAQQIKDPQKEKHYLLTISNLLSAMTMEPKLLEHPIEPGERHNNVYLAFGGLLLGMNLPDLAFKYCDQAEQDSREDPIRELKGLTAVRIHVLRAQCLDLAQANDVPIPGYDSEGLNQRLAEEITEAKNAIRNVVDSVVPNYPNRPAIEDAERGDKEGLDAALQEVRIYLGIIKDLSTKTPSGQVSGAAGESDAHLSADIEAREFDKKIEDINNLLDPTDLKSIEKEEEKRKQPVEDSAAATESTQTPDAEKRMSRMAAEERRKLLYNYLVMQKSSSQIV